jgi:hypothetical protein
MYGKFLEKASGICLVNVVNIENVLDHLRRELSVCCGKFSGEKF